MAKNIKHIVMWDVKGETAAEKRRSIEIIKNCFESLRGRVPGLVHIEIGVDFSRIDYACDLVLYSEFSSLEALAKYATDPEHIRIKHEIGDLRIARHQVDYVSETDI
ncbi:Dabb family protein [Pseudomonas huanghezhanensis]|uniref:Dabb family protein n=1 Tax=Pseudomonas huanghezhanensis TaxID=3002903 RepID=UPI0022865775|nr:Dabb family protein [Pseudomonas sp. BSw22131]